MLHFIFYGVNVMWNSISDLKQAFKHFDAKLLSENYHSDAEQVLYWLRENLYHSKSTSETYRESIFRFYLWVRFYKQTTLAECTRHNIIEYLEFIQNIPNDWRGTFRRLDSEDWRPFSKTILSKRSVNYSRQLIHQLFNFLHQTNYIQISPVAFPIKKIKFAPTTNIDKYFTINESKAIYRAILSLDDNTKFRKELKNRAKWIFKLLFYTGCRKSEIIHTTMDGFILINNQLWLRVLGKGSKIGDIPVVMELETALNEYRSYYGLPPIREKTAPEKDIPLVIKRLVGNEYQKMSKDVMNHQLKSICLKLAEKSDYNFSAKLRAISAHWLRHTSATIQANSGVDLRIVKDNLRHSSIQTTMNYQHLDKIAQHNETSDKFQIQL